MWYECRNRDLDQKVARNGLERCRLWVLSLEGLEPSEGNFGGFVHFGHRQPIDSGRLRECDSRRLVPAVVRRSVGIWPGGGGGWVEERSAAHAFCLFAPL